jgi:type I restriction enzyme S subunit
MTDSISEIPNKEILKSFGFTDFPENWDIQELGDLLSSDRGISVGVMYPGDHDPLGIPLIKVTDLKENRINPRPDFRISKSKHEEYIRTEFQSGELLITLVGEVGKCAIVPSQMKGYNAARAIGVLRFQNQEEVPFIRWCLLTTPIHELMVAWSNTTVQTTLNLKEIKKIPIPWPPKEERNAIARILGSLDDKIELNRQMNETLEAMARAIFQSWFVDFDPVRAKAEGRKPSGINAETAALFPDGFEEVDMREVPKGWGIGIADDICEKISDGSHYSPKENDEGPCIIGTVKDMDDFDFNLNSCKRITIDEYEKLVKTDCKPKCGDVLLSKDGTMGIPHLYIGHQDLVILSSIAIFRPKKEIYSHYLYWFLKSELFQSNLSTYSSGSVLTRMVCRDLKRIEILCPDEKILQEFLSHVKVLHSQIIQNCEQSRTLAEIRDALLPKLMSGEIQAV